MGMDDCAEFRALHEYVTMEQPLAGRLPASNPWGLSVFTNDKSQNGAMTIEPGQSLRYRYRVIIHPGTVKDADIAGLFTKYIARR
jgi:hypothetical protein